ncbi:MAG: hypothetical protein SVW02_03390 [Candidatus Nanohaloarchaea archaeon]|nr:hypothetical protein [Candidatus Nanohaloarchaea archaeon]
MDAAELRKAGWLAVGTVLIAGGGTISVLASFRNRFLPVYGGILLFIAGYKLSWYGVHPVERRRQQRRILEHLRTGLKGEVEALLRETVLLLTGGFLASIGIFVFARTVRSPGILKVVAAGTIGFAGYMLAHEELNDALV